MTIVTQMMLIFLIVCAIAVCLTRNLLTSVIIYMGYSMIMSIIWITLESPDLAITEAAVGAGITSLLFFLTLKKIHAIDARNEVRRAHERRRRTEVRTMATPEWFAKLKRRTAEIIDFENDALERDMVRTQETPSETHETEEDIARRVRLERERRRKRKSPPVCTSGTAAT